MTYSVSEEMAARIEAVDIELKAGSTLLSGLLAMLGSDLIQPGICTDLGLPMGREGTAMHAIEIAHFLHTADLHGIDLIGEMNETLYAGRKDEESTQMLNGCRQNIWQARAAAQEGLSIALNAVERLRAGDLGNARQRKEMAAAAERVKGFIGSAESTTRRLRYVKDLIDGKPAHPAQLFGDAGQVQVLHGAEAVRFLSSLVDREQTEQVQD